MALVDRRIVLARRPHGEPRPEHFHLEESRAPTAREDDLVLSPAGWQDYFEHLTKLPITGSSPSGRNGAAGVL